MSLIWKLPQILDECRQQYDEFESEPGKYPIVTNFSKRKVICPDQRGDVAGERQENPPGKRTLDDICRTAAGDNLLAWADNLDLMRYLLSNGFRGKLKLIYIDPPFYSNADYEASASIERGDGSNRRVRSRAYRDVWENGMEGYLSMLILRLLYMKELLSDDGGIWVHLDWHVVHYVKVLMDEIFGAGNFINEVVWTYKSGGTSKRHFARKHDTLLYYGKTSGYFFQPVKEKSYNRGMKPYRFKGVQEFQDEIGWYTMVNKKDVWQIDMVGRTSGERTGYATQKPELLLEQILESCTQEGDLCADFFCGSGTMASAAVGMNRRFITCDSGKLAVAHTYNRLLKSGIPFAVLGNMPGGRGAVAQGTLLYRGNSGFAELHLQRYICPSLDDLHLSSKDREKLRQTTEENPIQLIAAGSIGFQKQDGVYEPERVFHNTKDGRIVFQGLRLEREKAENVRVEVTDIFGNCIEVELK